MSEVAQKLSPRAPRLDDLLAKFSPATPKEALPVVVRRLNALSKELCIQTFAQKYVESGFSAIEAYRALRPNCSVRVAQYGAAKWLGSKEVKRYVLWLTQEGLRNARIGIEYVLAQAKSMAESNMFDFLEVAANGRLMLRVDPAKLSMAQKLNLRAIKFDAETGEVTEVKLPDREKANGQILDCLKVMADLAGGAGSSAAELGKRLDAAAKRKRQVHALLPPPINVRPISG